MAMFPIQENWRKPVRFGLYGAVGCLLAALIAEPLYGLLPKGGKPPVDVMFVVDTTASMQFAIDGTRDGIQKFADELGQSDLDARVGLIAFRDEVWTPPKVDVAFVLDISGSMQFAIDGVRDGIQDFARQLEQGGMDVRVGLLGFRDELHGEPAQVLRFGQEFFTRDFVTFRRRVGSELLADGGGDDPESSYDALAETAQQDFRPDAKKVFILVTDAPPHAPDQKVASVSALAETLKRFQGGQLHLVIRQQDREFYEPLWEVLPGQFFSLEDAARGRRRFDSILPDVARQIATGFAGGTRLPAAAPGVAGVSPAGAPAGSGGGEPQRLLFDGEPFTADSARFRREVAKLQADGGGDIPESSLDAVALAAEQPFREDAAKVLVLVTDAPPQIPDRRMQSTAEAAQALQAGQIKQLHLVTLDQFRANYADLQTQGAPGQFFSLAEAVRNEHGFAALLPEIGKAIVKATLQGVSSSSGFAARDIWRVLLVLAIWTALLAVGISLALIAGQNISVRRPWLTKVEAQPAAMGSAIAGAVTGVATQLLFFVPQMVTSGESWLGWLLLGVARIAAWVLLGAALGSGMAFFVPNLRMSRGMLGGAVGGCLGGLGFLLASLGGDLAGRLLGAGLLGFCIGLMVALAELAFRSAWLEVAFGPKEITTVTLGPEPVSIGSRAGCTVWASGGPEVAFKYWIRQGALLCEDVVRQQTTEVTAGNTQTVGRVTATVRTSANAQAAPAAGRPAPPPPPPIPGGPRPAGVASAAANAPPPTAPARKAAEPAAGVAPGSVGPGSVVPPAVKGPPPIPTPGQPGARKGPPLPPGRVGG